MMADISDKPRNTSPLRLSVILSSYNYAKFLPHAIEAILSQSLQPDEFIIFDDASSDNSVEIIKRYIQKNPTIRLVQREQNEGVLSTLNDGLNLAKGHFIIYAAADDLVLPGLFEKSIRLLEKYPQAAYCSSLTTIIDEKGNQLGPQSSPIVAGSGYISPHDARRYLRNYGFWLMGNTAVFRRQSLAHEGGFLPELGPLCDSFVAQVMALRHGACFIPEYLASWRRFGNGYLMSTLADGTRAMGFMNIAQHLMKTKYNDLFPADYALRWENEWIYAIGLAAGEKYRENQNSYLDSLRNTLAPLHLIDRILLWVLKVSASAKILLVRAYFFIRLKQLSRDKIKRKIKKVTYNCTHWFKKKRGHF